MITLKSEQLKKIDHLAELLEEEINNEKTEKTTCYAVWGNDSIISPYEPLPHHNEIEKKEPHLIDETQLEVEEAENKVEDTTPILRLLPGIFAGYHKESSPYSLYHAYEGDVYFDFSKESNIESLLRSNWTPSETEWNLANLSLQMINKYGITKYNEYPHLPENFVKSSNIHNILLVDQPIDDESVISGSANEQTFNDMLMYAFDNFPYSTIYVKLHPDTIDKKKAGYLKKLLERHQLSDHPSIRVIDEHCNITSFFNFTQEIFVVTSQVGFEALLRGKSVTCFGMPFYAGWGLTNDMQVLTDAKPKRTLMDLFVALVIRHTIYLNPFTKTKGTILDLLEYISLQQRHSNNKSIVFYNSQIAESTSIQNLLQIKDTKIVNIKTPKKFKKHYENLILSENLKEYQTIVAHKCKNSAFIMPGFLFPSVSTHKEPTSLIVDYNGPYFDPKCYSDLEFLIANETFTEYEKQLSDKFISALKIRYDILSKDEPIGQLLKIKKEASNKTIIFVPGQIRIINPYKTENQNDYNFLTEIIESNSNKIIIYKPISLSENSNSQEVSKDGLTALSILAEKHKNKLFVETSASISNCINYSEEVHTITHECGVEALIKGKKLITYGQAFYAGLGLTEDKEAIIRPKKPLSLNELVLATYMLYPRYQIPGRNDFMSATSALEFDQNKNITAHMPIASFSGLFQKIRLLFN